MTAIKVELAKLGARLFTEPLADAPEAEFTIAPESAADAAAILRFASEHKLQVLFWGGGTHQGVGHPVDPDLIVWSGRMQSIVDWQAEDLTVVVEPGVAVADLESRLQQRGQTAVLPEAVEGSTVAGVVAAGLSGWRRLRYGPTRDRVLEVVLATGDGRVVRAGGRLVKNVTGYDLPRLATGSLGSLGMIAAVCLKLWPLPTEQAMLEVDDPRRSLQAAYRPFAVLETEERSTVYLAGTVAEIEAQAEAIGGRLTRGHRWPAPLRGEFEGTLRVANGKLPPLLARMRANGWRFQAAHGVGEVRFAVDDSAAAEILALRSEAESTGGALVLTRCPADDPLDPWGTPPETVELQRRLKVAFDPHGIANPGRLPGGI